MNLIAPLVGATALGGLEGLDFILTALFVVLTIDAYRATPDKHTLALAAGAGAIAFLVAPDSMLLVAMAIFTVTLVARHTWNREKTSA